MASALLSISSLSQPVRALTRWLSRSVAGPRPLVRSGGTPGAQGAPAQESVPAAAHDRRCMEAVLHDASRTGVSPRWVAKAAANRDRFVDPASVPAVATAVSARTVRVLHRTDAGGPMRLVISGRMADVCAELDRLVAREAALT